MKDPNLAMSMRINYISTSSTLKPQEGLCLCCGGGVQNIHGVLLKFPLVKQMPTYLT